ncbi:MAG: hypothetical protein RR033_04045 [Clostridia bacterium]
MFNYVIGTRDRHIFLRLNFQIKKSVAICLAIHLFGSKIKNKAVIILKFFIVGTGGDGHIYITGKQFGRTIIYEVILACIYYGVIGFRLYKVTKL